MKYIRIPQEPFFLCPGFEDNRHMVCHLNPVKHLLLRRLSGKALPVLKRYGLTWVGCFVGILYTGRVTVDVFKKAIRKLERRGVEAAEILFHPANIDDRNDAAAKGGRVPHYYYLKERKIEKQNLLSREMTTFLQQRQIELVTHRTLEKSRSQEPGSSIPLYRKNGEPEFSSRMQPGGES